MKITLEPMLGIIGLSGGELILILIVLLFPVALVAFGLGVFLLLRAKQRRAQATFAASPTVKPSTASPTHSVARNRALWISLGLLVAAIGGTILAVAMDNKAPTGDLISAAEFNQLVSSNRIIKATVSFNSGSPTVVRVTGIYEKTDSTGGKTATQFTTPKMVMTAAALDRLESLPDIETSESNNGISPFCINAATYFAAPAAGLALRERGYIYHRSPSISESLRATGTAAHSANNPHSSFATPMPQMRHPP